MVNTWHTDKSELPSLTVFGAILLICCFLHLHATAASLRISGVGGARAIIKRCPHTVDRMAPHRIAAYDTTGGSDASTPYPTETAETTQRSASGPPNAHPSTMASGDGETPLSPDLRGPLSYNHPT